MPNVTVTQSDDPSNSRTDPGFLLDEFLPIVEFKDFMDYEVEGDERSLAEDENGQEESAELSKYLDPINRNIQVFLLTTTRKKIKIPFTVKKGGDASWDEDGIVETKLSIDDPEVKLLSKLEVKTKYNSEIEVEIEFTGQEAKEFYIQFYARDNEESLWHTGELKDVYCGCVKVKSKFLKRKKVYYSISLMTETDYRSNNFQYYKDFIKVKNSAFGHIELGNYLANESKNIAENDSSFPGGESIRFLALFSHGYTNTIFGDSNDHIDKSEITAMFSDKSIHFSEDAIIFLGACNAGTGGSGSFAQKLADVTKTTVIGMVGDGVSVVDETTGNSTTPKMIYGPKYGDKYGGKFYKFSNGITPVLLKKEVDIISLLSTQKLKE